MGKTVKDFNKLSGDERWALLADKTINVSKVPARITLELADFSDSVKEGTMGDKEKLGKAFDLVGKVCRLNGDAEITTDWLLDNLDLDQLLAFMEFVLEPVQERCSENNEGGSGKNVEGA